MPLVGCFLDLPLLSMTQHTLSQTNSKVLIEVQAGTTLRRASSAPSMSAQPTLHGASLRAISSVEMQQPSSPHTGLQGGLQLPPQQTVPALPYGDTLLQHTSAGGPILAPYLPLAQQLQQMQLQTKPQGETTGEEIVTGLSQYCLTEVLCVDLPTGPLFQSARANGTLLYRMSK